MLRSLVAVVVGFVTIGALSVGASSLLQRAVPAAFTPQGGTSDVAMIAIMTLCVAVFAIFGCWLCGMLAPRKRMAHALVLGVLGLLFNIAQSVAAWDLFPAWAHVLGIALTMPYAWIGGRLAERRPSGDAPFAAAR